MDSKTYFEIPYARDLDAFITDLRVNASVKLAEDIKGWLAKHEAHQPKISQKFNTIYTLHAACSCGVDKVFDVRNYSDSFWRH